MPADQQSVRSRRSDPSFPVTQRHAALWPRTPGTAGDDIRCSWAATGLLLLAVLLPATARAAVVRGTVLDPDGRPVPGATVVVVGATAATASALTDASGIFRFDPLPAGRYQVIVSKTGFRADPASIDLRPDADVELTIRLHLGAIAESVVVSAAHVDLPLSRAPGTVTVISRDDLEARQIDTVAGALRLVPGLSVTETGGRGGIVSLFPRGGESDFTLVMLDGVKLNAFGGGFDFSETPVHDIERIEIVRGPQSAVFGADAIGGVVHLVSRRSGPAVAHGLVEGGGLGTARVALGAGGSFGRWNVSGSAERLRSSGFTGTAPASGERVGNDDAEYTSVGGRAAWRGHGGAEVGASLRTGWSDRGFPGPFGSNPIGAFPGVDLLSRGRSRSVQTGVRVSLPFAAVGRGGRQLFQVGHLDAASDFTGAYGLSESGSGRWSLRSQTDVDLSASVGLSAGVELQRERATSTFITGASAEAVPVRRLAAGYFAEGRWQPTPRALLAAGLRVEQIRRDRLEDSPSPYSPRPAFDTGTVVSVNPRASLTVALGEGRAVGGGRRRALASTRLRVSAGTGIRPPDALEIAFTDNPELRPERSRSVEAGIEQGIAGDAARIEVTAFWNTYDDLIVAVGRAIADASRYRTDNIANARAGGIEVGLAAWTPFGLELRAAYTWLASSVLAVDGVSGQAPAPFAVGDQLIRRPRHQGTLDLVLRRSRVTVSARIGGRGRVLDVEPNWGTYGGLFHNPGYLVANAAVSVRLAPAVEALARVNNLLDRPYEEAFGFPSPGRVATFGVRFAVGR